MRISVHYFHDVFGGAGASGPSPARLYQALACAAGDGRTKAHELALRWLEEQAPPVISRRALGVDEWRVAYGRAAAPTDPDAKEAIEEHVRRWTNGNGGGAHVMYTWRSTLPAEHAAAMEEMVCDLDRLGVGTDHAWAVLDGAAATPPPGSGLITLTPTIESGGRRERERFRVPYPGLLKDLDARERSRRKMLEYRPPKRKGTKMRLLVHAVHAPAWREQTYDRRENGATKPKGTPTTRAWAVLRLSEPQDATLAAAVCGALRHAAGRAAERTLITPGEKALKVEGHRPDGRPAPNDAWLSYLALPSLSGPYPDGRIRRVMIAGPNSLDETWTDLVERLIQGLIGSELKGWNGRAYGRLEPAEVDRTVLDYVGPHREWATATPALLRASSTKRSSSNRARTENKNRASARAERRRQRVLDHAARDCERWSGVVATIETIREEPGRRPANEYCRKHWYRNDLQTHLKVRTETPAYGPLTMGRGSHGGAGLLIGSARKKTDNCL